ncbi:hypothetical protein CFP56_040728 [Quercus suber]|uniref:Uncharacterized protein n=1 Tax=Quercus suber TaxID=58331 RepID=A0AAW0IWR6_QUESU
MVRMQGNKWDIGKDQVSGIKRVTLERGYESSCRWGDDMRICIKSHHRIHDGANLQCDADNIQLFLAEVKLAWIVHIVAAILKTLQISGQLLGENCVSHQALLLLYSSGELQEVFDAELSACV